MTLRGGLIVAGIMCVAAMQASVATRAAAPIMVKDDDLVPYTILDTAIPRSLTGADGDAAAGAKIVVDRGLGNCMSCHGVGMPQEPFPGNVGPDLAGVGSRLNAGELRLRLVDPKRLNEATSMPAFYKVDGLNRVASRYAGKPILTAAEIEDVIAYLLTLRQ